MISINDLHISYGKKKVIENLSVSLTEGNIHGIVGLNGAGKTTLLNTIFGLKKQEKGTIQWKNESISRKSIAFLPTEPFFYPNITGKEYLEIFPGNNFNLEKWNALFKLPLNNLVDNYSTGMKKKLALLSTIKPGKEILILDEPFNGLDLETTRILRSVILNLKKQGKTILISSHILETLTNLCDFLYYLSEKHISKQAKSDKFDEFEQFLFKSIKEKNREALSELFDQEP